MRVIGTAGHVDHGKSTLVQALTGTHPDRLKEEQEREMTIDLGFAWMNLPKSQFLPQGEEVGIVDVPGHRDFIENMLSGVGGIDAVLFVIAADEGVMPQTREHLAILNILQVGGGVIVLTKVDLIDDAEWLELIEEDVHRAVMGTVLEHAPVVRFSSRTKAGLTELIGSLSACLAQHPPRLDLGRPRLPVDRIFTISGFGTVVTGTLVDGCLKVGDDVLVLGSSQGSLRGRIRGLQTHKRKEEIAVPGSRTAVNISGVNVEQVFRGDVIVHPGDYTQTRRLDVRFRLLPDVSQPLHHNTEVKLFLGAAEVVARLRLLGENELLPGQEAWLQLEFEHPLVAMRGDRYILRRPSPGETLGGGIVVDPHPSVRHKRFSSAALERLNAIMQGTPAELLFQAMLVVSAAPFQDVIARAGRPARVASQAARELIATGQLLVLENEESTAQDLPASALVACKPYWVQLVAQLLSELRSYHAVFSLRRGMPKEELKSRLKVSSRLFMVVMRRLINQGELEEAGPLVFRKGFVIQFNPQQKRQVDNLLLRFAASPFAPPTVKDCQAEVGEEVYNALVELGELVFIPPDVVFRGQDYQYMVAEVRGLFKKQETITAAQVRDHFNTSRRYALAFLEHLDSLGITVREGDVRRLIRKV